MKSFTSISKGLFVIALTVGCMSIDYKASAQYDPMFTQYMNNELFINPAYAGSRDYISATALYRNQWAGIDGAPVTQTFTIHAPLKKKKVGLGLGLMHEEIGVSRTLSMYGNYAYRLYFSESNILAFGLQGGVTSLSEKLSELSPFNTTGPNDPLILGDTPTRYLPKAGFGMYYFTDRFYAGWSIPRLINNRLDPFNDYKVVNEVDFNNWHHYLAVGYVFDASENVQLKPSVMAKTVAGAPVEIDISLNALFNKTFWLGAAYRTGDAVSLLTSLNVSNQFRIGYAYDYTLTELGNHTHGTHEIMLGYDFSFNKRGVSSIRYF